MSSNTSRRYPPELRERAVRMVAEVRSEHVSEWAAIEPSRRNSVSAPRRPCITGSGGPRSTPGSGPGSLPRPRRNSQAPGGDRELKRANEILKSASTFFAAELDRRQK